MIYVNTTTLERHMARVATKLDGSANLPAAALKHQSDDELAAYGLARVAPTPVPEGYRSTGYSFEKQGDTIVQVHELVEVRPMIAKSVVQQRLIDAGLIGAARTALNADDAAFARWFAPDHGAVYCDDPDALALLAAIGADAETIMAPENAS